MNFQNQKSFKEKFFSFGIMLLGVSALFIFTIVITPQPAPPPPSLSPANAVTLTPRNTLLIGGDIAPMVVPVHHPNVPLPKPDKKDFTQKLSAVSVIAVDDRTDTELFFKNPDTVRPLASITKLMSALVLLDLNLKWDKVAEIADDDDIGGSHIANVGEKYTLEDLWHLALIGSSNTAVNTLVRASGLTHEQFVARMNAKARQWRLNSAKFVEPTGLNAGNVADTRDTARLLKFALREDKIFDTMSTGEYYAQPVGVAKSRRVWSTDWLLTGWIPHKFGPDSIVGKTGYITDSGYNFVVRVAGEGDAAVRVAVMGADANESRFTEARDLAVWALKNYVWPNQAGYSELVE